MMQSQRIQQRAITASQSLQVVQTLLRAGFGCVTYLRGLLPDENFTEAHLTSSGSPSSSQSASQDSSMSFEPRPLPSGAVKLKTIKRGWTKEGDKLLEYLEEGIFDALEKQYLRSFIFAVYLDDKDPENVIEAYTFNFSYLAVPGITSKVPIMTLGEKLDKMSLSSRSTVKVDPVAEAMAKGKAPTLGDVKQSVKNLVRSLIAAIQTLNALPKRRFATFKVFYMDHVPESYEPPHFSAGNPKNKYFFTTHSTKEIPEKMSIGSLVTPYHGLKMQIGSVTDFIPQSGNNDGANFNDLVNHEESSYSATQAMSLADRKKLIKVQQQDALLRKVVWDAEAFANPQNDHIDAEGEDDTEYQGQMSEKHPSQQPTGIRCADGTIVEMSVIGESESYESPILYPGMEEDEPDNIKKTIMFDNVENQATQIVEPSPFTDSPLTKSPHSPSPAACSTVDPLDTMISKGTNTQVLQDVLKQRDAEEWQSNFDGAGDMEMLDIETQQPVGVHAQDTPAKSFFGRADGFENQTAESPSSDTPKPVKAVPQLSSSASNDQDAVVDCDCGVHDDTEYGVCQCEGPCGRWLHVWCMGYHSVDDPRLPHVFLCFSCRLRNDPQIEVLDSRSLTLEYITKFKDLSLFRRALKIIEVHRPETVTSFKQLLGSEASTAGQTWKRLEAEGFIALQTSDTDSIGLLESRGVLSRKSKGKQKAKKNIKRAKYSPVPEAMTGKNYEDYFQPAKEGTLLGMIKLKSTASGRTVKPQAFKVPEFPQVQESQIQSGSNQLSVQENPHNTLVATSQTISKRKTDGDEASVSRKRIKISIGPGVSLDD